MDRHGSLVSYTWKDSRGIALPEKVQPSFKYSLLNILILFPRRRLLAVQEEERQQL